jgi:hypothetical protein
MVAPKQPPKIKDRQRRFRRRRVRQAGEPTALDLIEEGVNLLRRTPIGAWSVYLCGVAPFLVGFLFFWMEMATSGLAERNLLPASLGMALLFVWLKAAQCYFARGLREALFGHPEPGWSLRTWLRVIRRQSCWQGTGLIVLPIAFVVTIPFAWVFALYQNMLTADPAEVDSEAEGYFQTNWQLARMWTEQNWMLLSLFGLVGLLSWLNWLSLVFFGPYLLKALLGVETVFSRVGGNLFNSTTLFACLLLSYVVTDPLVKAVYLLRRHYGESRRSGADLRLRLRGYARRSESARATSLLVLLSLGALALMPAPAQAAETTPASAVINVDELDASIDEVLERREFVWRFPREEVDAEKRPGWLRSWIESLETLQERFEKWLEDFFGLDRSQRSEGSFWDDIDLAALGSLLSYLLIGSFVLLVLLLALRAWKMYAPDEAREAHSADRAEPEPDLEDEDVSADLMPRNRWVELARKLIAEGDYRLALRAYFLAQLSAFSSEGLIVIRQAKSNREYAGELSQRGHGDGNLLDLYWGELRLFESVWYGERPPGPAEIEQMEGYLRQQGVLG